MFFWGAITKNRVYPFGEKNGYHLESSQKYTPRATRLAKNKSYPFLSDNDPGTPVNGYYAWLGLAFNRFWLFFLLNHWRIVYIVLHCCFGRYFLFSFCVSFCSFNFSLQVSFHSIQPLCAPGYVRPHVHTYKPRTYHCDCCAISFVLIVQGIKQAHTETK